MKRSTTHPTRSIGFLSRLHDDELSEAERRDFEIHALECRECAAAAAEFEQILALYRQAQAEPADPELAARISRRLDARLRWRPPVRYIRLEIDLLWASVVATCLVAALALYSLRPSRKSPVPVSVVAETRVTPAPPGRAPEPPTGSGALQSRSAPRPRAETQSGMPASGFAPEPAPSAPTAEARAPIRADEWNPPSEPALQPLPGPALSAPGGALGPSIADEKTAGEVFRVGPGITTPVLVHRVEPVFPDSLRYRTAMGRPVILEAVVDEAGEVVNPRVIRSNPPFDRLVIDAVRQWKYKPATKDGKPVSVILVVTCNIDVR